MPQWVLLSKRFLRRVLRRGSQKGFSTRSLERPLGEYDLLGVRPEIKTSRHGILMG